jgi:predicted enzyme related to lactoylglutathione lyase
MKHVGHWFAAIAALLSVSAAHAQAAPARTEAALPAVKALVLMASAIPCSDLERSIAFYTKGLGMTSAGRIEMGTVTEAPLMFPGGGTYLMLLRPKAGPPQALRGPHNRIILNVPDLKVLVAQLNAAGYQIKGKVNESTQYRVAIAHVEDPDGNHIELVQRLP